MFSDNLEWQLFSILCKHYNIDLFKPIKELTPFERDIILHGSKEPISYTLSSSSGITTRKTKSIEGIGDLIERRYEDDC